MKRRWIKICGLTRSEEARAAVQLGADLIGLNFHPPSPRYLEAKAARRIADSVRGKALLVGVFVNRTTAEIRELAEEIGLDLIQLHGDEDDEIVHSFGHRAIKAFRLDSEHALPRLEQYPAAWGFLFDRGGDRRFGGTGRSWAYDRLSGLSSARPVLVAGGIHPENARRALRASGASGIDVCSGVEASPGRKDPTLMKRLFEEVRRGEAPILT